MSGDHNKYQGEAMTRSQTTPASSQIITLERLLEEARIEVDFQVSRCCDLERENAQLKAVIEQQKEVIDRLTARLSGACESGLNHMGTAANYRRKCHDQSVLIETLAEAVRYTPSSTGFTLRQKALQQYELWKESR